MNIKLVGILNVTPDSFSDGGAFVDAAAAIAHAEALIADGAGVLDVGAESTRPNAQALSAEEEWTRLAVVIPDVVARAHAAGVAVSVDTRHAAVAQAALALGVDWLNDVTGFADAAMRAVAARSAARLVVMHSLSVPVDPKETLPEYLDPVAEVLAWGAARIAELEAAGIARERIIFDPGIGFGKTAAQSLEIIRRAGELKALGVPLLVGHSRKSCLTLMAGTEKPAAERDPETLVLSEYMCGVGVEFLRVHNVQMHREMIARTT